MRNMPSVRYVRILVKNNGIPEWFTSTLRVRENGTARSAELTIQELEEQCEKAAQTYGYANVDVADSGATSLQAAEVFFNSMGLKNAEMLPHL